jgi:hypothetical protein
MKAKDHLERFLEVDNVAGMMRREVRKIRSCASSMDGVRRSLCLWENGAI